MDIIESVSNTPNVLKQIQAWEIKHNLLGKNRYIPMLEAYRRTMEFHKGDSSKSKMLALPSELKNVREYFTPSYCALEHKRCLNWYDLTDKGRAIIDDLINTITWSENLNTILFNQKKF